MRRNGERGQALIVAILALLVLTLLGLALTSMSMVSMTVSINDREAGEAFYAADSGVAHAVAILESQAWTDFDPALQRGDGRGCTGDELAPLPSPPPELAPAAELIPAGGRAFPPAGRYEVRVCDDDSLERSIQRPPGLPDSDPDHDANARVLIRSTGMGGNGASATVEALLMRVELAGLLVDGNLRLNGNTSVMGAGGSVHANGSLELLGTPCAQQYFSATGGVSGAGSALGGGGCSAAGADVRPNQEEVAVPMLAPASLRQRAAYILGADGQIRDPAGAPVALAGWSWDSGAKRWSGGPDIPGGAYYVEGNVEISGNPGNVAPASAPLPLTLIAEGSVDFTGAPRIVPALMSFPAYAVVAGADVRLAGNPGASYTGLFYARDQIDFTGNPTLVGQVIAKDAGDQGFPAVPADPAQNNLVRRQDGAIALGGNARIFYDGAGGLAGVAITGWRECRGPDPDDPCGLP
jgi:hypothetical protein